MLDYQVQFGEMVSVYEPYDDSLLPQHKEEIRQEECSHWGNYALFMFEQQGSYCQLG